MHKEIVKGKSNAFFLVLITVTIGLALISLLNFFDLEKYRTVFELIILLLTVIAVFIILRFCLCQFIYVIINDKFVIHRIMGKKDEIVFSLEFSKIEKIGKNKDTDFSKFGKIKGSFNFGQRLLTKNMYGVIFKNKFGDYSKFSFEPSAQLLELFEEKLKDFNPESNK